MSQWERWCMAACCFFKWSLLIGAYPLIYSKPVLQQRQCHRGTRTRTIWRIRCCCSVDVKSSRYLCNTGRRSDVDNTWRHRHIFDRLLEQRLHIRIWVCFQEKGNWWHCLITQEYSLRVHVIFLLWMLHHPRSLWELMWREVCVCVFCSSDRWAHHGRLQAQAVSLPLGSLWWQGLWTHRGRDQVPCWGNEMLFQRVALSCRFDLEVTKLLWGEKEAKLFPLPL